MKKLFHLIFYLYVMSSISSGQEKRVDKEVFTETREYSLGELVFNNSQNKEEKIDIVIVVTLACDGNDVWVNCIKSKVGQTKIFGRTDKEKIVYLAEKYEFKTPKVTLSRKRRVVDKDRSQIKFDIVCSLHQTKSVFRKPVADNKIPLLSLTKPEVYSKKFDQVIGDRE